MKYEVRYGNYTSSEKLRTLKDVHAFVAYCLRENVPIREITKIKHQKKTGGGR